MSENDLVELVKTEEEKRLKAVYFLENHEPKMRAVFSDLENLGYDVHPCNLQHYETGTTLKRTFKDGEWSVTHRRFNHPQEVPASYSYDLEFTYFLFRRFGDTVVYKIAVIQEGEAERVLGPEAYGSFLDSLKPGPSERVLGPEAFRSFVKSLKPEEPEQD